MFSVKIRIKKDERRTPLRKFSFDFMGLLYQITKELCVD